MISHDFPLNVPMISWVTGAAVVVERGFWAVSCIPEPSRMPEPSKTFPVTDPVKDPVKVFGNARYSLMDSKTRYI